MKPSWSIFDCRNLISFHLPLTDDGLTFGTNAQAGVCIHFEPRIHRVVGFRDHSALTVTVADVEGLVAALNTID